MTPEEKYNELKSKYDSLVEAGNKVVSKNEEYEVKFKEMETDLKETKFKASLTGIKTKYTKANGKAEGFDLFASRNKEALLEGKTIEELSKDKSNGFFFNEASKIDSKLGEDKKVETKDDKINSKFYGRSLNAK